MNLIQRTHDLGKNIPKLKRLQDEKHRLEEYTAHKDVLLGVTQRLGLLADIAHELQKRGVVVTGLKTSILGLRKHAQKIDTAFRDDKTVVIAPETAESFWHPLKKMPQKVERELEKVWRKYVESKIPAGQTEILSILSRVQGFAGQAATVNSHRNAMRNLGNQLPQQDDFKTLDDLADQVEQAWKALNGDGLPPAVLNFLKKAHLHGISLADLDEEVLEWLRQQDLLNKYIVRGR